MVKEAIQGAVETVTPLVTKLAESLKVPAEAVWQALVAEAKIRGYASLAGVVVWLIFSVIALIVSLSCRYVYYSSRLVEKKRIEALNLAYAKEYAGRQGPFSFSSDFGIPYAVVGIIAAIAFALSFLGCCIATTAGAGEILTGILAPEAGAVRSILNAVLK